MHILILGATGRTGGLLLDEAIKRGHRVSVLVSHRGNLRTDNKIMKVYEGTPLNKYTLAEAMEGCDAILSTLNISRVTDNPWSNLRTGKKFLSLSMKNILETTKEHHLKRIIVTTAWGVAETRKDLPFWFRWLIKHSNIRFPYEDHEWQEEMLKHSKINWTIVRPVILTNSDKKKEVQVTLNNEPKPKLKISRKNVANFMLDILEKKLHIKECPVISEK